MNKEEVLHNATVEFGSEFVAKVWYDKYAYRENDDNVYDLSPSDTINRMVKEISRIEETYPNPLSYNDIHDMLFNFEYVIPQGGSLYGIGTDYTTSLSNCFVISNPIDSYGAICKTDEEQIQLMKRRGGVGHDLSHIREKGSIVHNAANTSTGIVPFMERYSNSTREVAQGGRRGALMLTLDVNHPDILDFISAKLDTTKITGANISVKVDDGTMANIVAGNNDEIFNNIVYNSWKTGEPGILFWDTVLSQSPALGYGDYWKEIATNPCGEIPLPSYDSCLLLTVNMYNFVTNKFLKNAEFDILLFKTVVRRAIRIADDIVDLEIEKLDKIIDTVRNNDESSNQVEVQLWEDIKQKKINGRRNGVGITGLGDMLAALGLRYGSDEANQLLSSVFYEFRTAMFEESVVLASERGSFPMFDINKELSPFIMKCINSVHGRMYHDMYFKTGRRNIGNLTIAPTGTVSILTQTSSGIEPVFNVKYIRRKKVSVDELYDFVDDNGDKWKNNVIYHKPFVEWYKIYTGDKKADIYSLSDYEFKKVFAKSPYYKSTAMDIDPIAKVKMQGMIQQFIDHSISCTINLPELTTQETISDIFKVAWESGCKGITVYRDGSRSGVLVNESTNNNKVVITRPSQIPCETHHVKYNNRAYTVLIGLINNIPYEIFVLQNKGVNIKNTSNGYLIKENGVYHFTSDNVDLSNITSYYSTDDEEFTTRLVSRLLRNGTPIQKIINDAEKTRSGITEFSQVIKRVLNKYGQSKPLSSTCPNCKSKSLVLEEGCTICKSCGWSKCS